MLVGQLIEELLLKRGQTGILLSGNGNGLALIARGVDLDQVLEFIVVDIVCSTRRLASGPLNRAERKQATYMEPIVAQTVPERSGRTSCLAID